MIHSDSVPENTKGKQTDLFAYRSFNSTEEAVLFFNSTCLRLLNPNFWAQFAGKEKASFLLFDREGNKLDRLVEVGDYIRIDLPGPGSSLGSGYDWVRVTDVAQKVDVETREALLSIMMRPSPAPNQTDSVAHFFNTGASSTIAVHMLYNKISTSHHGRNEVVNNNTDNLLDNIRNTLVASGARWGLSEIQWTALIEGLIAD